jgi:8-oxo-dGTP diphosphatase
MAKVPVLAAGGIVLRWEPPPLVAVVRLSKRDEWVLPKGKLDDGETPRAAARREVLEETGHDVTVHEFLGTLVYDSAGRPRVVHYWRMEAGDVQVRDLMNDVRAVEWLPLAVAVERLSRGYERVFLENVGPIAIGAMARSLKDRARRREAAVLAPQLPLDEPVPAPEPQVASPAMFDVLQTADETMPPRHQRASFAERVRNWLGGDA